MKVKIKVLPGSSKNQLVGWLNDCYKIKIKAVAENGKANSALIKFLGKTLGISSLDVKLVSGFTSPIKTIEISNFTESDLKKVLI